METLSFTLGILSVVTVIFVATIVLGIVRVVKQHQQINSLQRELERVWENNSQLNQEIHQRISSHQESMIRSIDETNQRIGRTETESHRHVARKYDDLSRQLDITRSDLNSYIDSRIDKLSANTKQLLKS
jgi:predicted PurR-regulated permease PerM